jgi:hypothetical protein
LSQIDDQNRKLQQNLTGLPNKIIRVVMKIINRQSVLLEGYVKAVHMTGGTTSDKLAVRSGLLRNSVRAIPAKISSNASIVGGINFGTIYARVHVGPRGQKTVIKPKGHPYLTIPLDAAKSPSGVAKGSPRLGPWADTFIARSKKGNLIIFGRLASYRSVKVGGTKVKGLTVRQVSKDVVPLFVLKESVTIPARIHPRTILDWMMPRVLADFKDSNITGAAKEE